jgi:hypothetical protein
VDDEDSRSSGLVQVSDGLYAEVPLWCASGPIAQRWIVPTCVWELSDCKEGVSVGRLPQQVLLEEFYRSECSETVQVERVRVFEEFLTVFNGSCVLESEELGRTRCVRRATDCN